VLESQFRVTQVILSLFPVDLGNHAFLLARIGAAFFPARGDGCDLGQVRGLALLERLLAGLDTLPFQVQHALPEGGLGLLELVGKLGAVDRRQHLARNHLLAGIDQERDRAGCRCIQGRTDGCHDASLYRDVTHQVAARDGRYADAFKRYADRCTGPALDPRRGDDRRRDHRECDPQHDKSLAARIARRQRHVLRRCIGNFQNLNPLPFRSSRNRRICCGFRFGCAEIKYGLKFGGRYQEFGFRPAHVQDDHP